MGKIATVLAALAAMVALPGTAGATEGFFVACRTTT
jgi:hypothetical protein